MVFLIIEIEHVLITMIARGVYHTTQSYFRLWSVKSEELDSCMTCKLFVQLAVFVIYDIHIHIQ